MSFQVGVVIPFEEAENFKKMKKELLETRKELEKLRAELLLYKSREEGEEESRSDSRHSQSAKKNTEQDFSEQSAETIPDDQVGQGSQDLEMVHHDRRPAVEKPWYFLGFPENILGSDRLKRTKLGKLDTK